MKNLIKILIAFVGVALVSISCTQEYSLGESYTIAQDQVVFDMTPGSDEFTFNFTASINVDPVKFPYAYEIRFGDGKAIKSLTGTHEYIVYAGTYTAQCLVYTPNGNIVIKDKSIIIAHDNDKLFSDDLASLQFALTGGKANAGGKTWFLGPWTGMRNPDNRNEVWWDFKDPAIMDDEFIFKPNGVNPNGAFTHINNGNSFMNESLGTLFPDGDPAGSFITEYYTPPTNATWEVIQRDGKTFLAINKGFFGYASSPDDLNKTEYEVVSFTPSSIRLILSSGWNGWCYELVNEAPANPLTGTGSKTWVIDGYNKRTAEAKAESGLAINGFMGLGPLNSNGQSWWAAGPGDKSFANVGWTFYDWKITFTSAGQLKIVTEGEGYGRKKFDGEGFNSTKIDGDDMSFPYNGGDYTYTLDNSSPYPKLTLSGNAFMGYYCGTQEYEIVALTDNVLAVVVHNTAEGQDWVFVYVPEGEQ